MQTSSDIAVILRDIDFRTESACEAAWLGGDPVATAVFLAAGGVWVVYGVAGFANATASAEAEGIARKVAEALNGRRWRRD